MTHRPNTAVPRVRHAGVDTASLAQKISIHHLNFYYGKIHALKDICLTLYTNKVTAIIGPSGCGKSTLLRVLDRIYGLYPNQHVDGQVMLDGNNVLRLRQDVNALRSRVGMVFQQSTPFPMSIHDNIALAITPYETMSRPDLDARIETALKRAAVWHEVKDVLKDSALSLSGGQQQRLCIARALASQPEVILFDEPCSSLDPLSTAKIEELIEDLRRDHTIAIVTHNLQEAARLSDFAAFMYLGELVEFDATERMFANPRDRRTHDYLHGGFG
ncbi:MAG: phosphate ABC transporter ATP-binding protein [Xanthobacteraceae bacterium]|nr:phosphate ABC transporter ATP-binding protein [Xanthobacteraceae bacterium]